MKFDYYLKLNDETERTTSIPNDKDKKSVYKYCKSGCIMHQLDVHSTVKQ